jgi:outer membrane immunogenic protein
MRSAIGLALLALTSSAAFAADLPVRTSPPQPVFVAAHNWTGFYIGGHVGYALLEGRNTQVAAPPPLLFPNGTVTPGDSSGILGGLQIGYNYQMNNLVLGIEADGSIADTRISVTTPSPLIPGAIVTGTTRANWYATLTGRLGFAANNWLFYAKGGLAAADFKFGGSANIPPAFVVNGISDTRFGWTIGAGVEYAFSRNWSAKLEYNYMDFGSKQYAFTTTPAVGATLTNVKLNAHVVKVGVNYLFGSASGPVVAKY